MEGAIALMYRAANEATRRGSYVWERSIYTSREMQSKIPLLDSRLCLRHGLRFFLATSISVLILLCVHASRAQESPAAPKPQTEATTAKAATAVKHAFWDSTNDWLFAGTGAARTLDYFSTLNMRRRGRQEILLTNDVVDNHAAFAVIEAAGTGVSIGAAYLFHRTGHHKLERWTSIVHISAGTTGSIRNYCLKTAHPAPVIVP